MYAPRHMNDNSDKYGFLPILVTIELCEGVAKVHNGQMVFDDESTMYLFCIMGALCSTSFSALTYLLSVCGTQQVTNYPHTLQHHTKNLAPYVRIHISTRHTRPYGPIRYRR